MYSSTPLFSLFPATTDWESIFDDWNTILNNSKWSYSTPFPPVNIDSDKDGCIIQLGLAGWKKEYLSLKIEKDTIIIKGNPPKEEASKKEIKRRMKKVEFQRIYRVPEIYDISKTKASYEDGLLEITIPYKRKEETLNKELEIL